MALSRSSKPSPSASLPRAQSFSPVLKVLAVALLLACVLGMGWAVWVAAAEAPSQTDASVGQVVVEPGAQPSSEELAAADYLAGRGHRVRLLPRDPASPDPQPDAQLDDDDFPTEIKTVGNLTGSEIAAGLSRRIREGLSQAPSIVVDAREQVELTQQLIEEGMKRALGKAAQDGKPVKRLHVIGPNGIDVNWDYTGSSTS